MIQMFKQSTILEDEQLKQIEKWLLKQEVKEENVLKKNLNELMMAYKQATDLKSAETTKK